MMQNVNKKVSIIKMIKIIYRDLQILNIKHHYVNITIPLKDAAMEKNVNLLMEIMNYAKTMDRDSSK